MAKRKKNSRQNKNEKSMTPEEFKAWAENELDKKIEVQRYLTEDKLFSLIQGLPEEEE